MFYYLTIISFINIYPQQKLIKPDTDFEYEYFFIINEDIFNYFNLAIKNETALKKKNFLNSEEGKMLVDSIKIIKKRILNKKYKLSFDITFPEYNLKEKGFGLLLEKANTSFNSEVNWLKDRKSSIGRLWLDKLPFSFYTGYFTLYKALFIKCPEETALKLEKQKSKITIIFNITGVVKKIKDYRSIFTPEDLFAVTKNIQMVVTVNEIELLSFKY